MGSSFSQELAAARFELAAETMREQPHVCLTDLAYELGYSSPAHFTRAFKRYAGVPPSSFLTAGSSSPSCGRYPTPSLSPPS